MVRIAVAVGLLVVCGCVNAQGAAPGQYTWEEYGKRIKTSEKVAPLGPELMGEKVSLSNGALSFSATDLSLPGNNTLEVSFSRSYSVFNRKDYPSDGMLADWQVDAPSISAVYAPDWLVGMPGSTSRCSTNDGPPVVSPFSANDFWQGLQLNIVGGGELLRTLAATAKPTNGPSYLWVTGDGRTHVSCLTGIKNGAGEGFLAITPDGTRYWFDWMAQTTEAPVKSLIIDSAGARFMHVLNRKKNYLYATRVEDRFGNYVEYTYTNAWNAPGKLTQITASDGRQISVAYSNGFVSSISDGARTWNYAYSSTSSGRTTLTAVTLPDASAWNIDFSAFTNAEIKYNEVPMGEILRTCTMNETPLNYGLVPVGTITHPSGAVGTFTVDIREHGRSSVPISCGNITSTGGAGTALGNDKNDDVNIWAISSDSFTLKQKRISGPGLITSDWNYSYAPNIGFVYQGGATAAYPVCDWENYNCALPPCPPSSCTGGSSKTVVTGPGGEWTRYSYGNAYLNNEGKLLKVETGTSDTNILKTVTNTYDLSQADQPSPGYPARYGLSQRGDGDGFPAEYHRPLVATATGQQAATFTRTNLSFDGFAQPTSVKRESSLGYSKTDAYTYENNLFKWVLGQIKTETCTAPLSCAGIVSTQVGYDPSTASQLTYTSFGKLLQTLTYNADGTVATVKDGNNNITSLGNWKRGIPQLITFPATAEAPAGATQSAVVNNQGWIDSVSIEIGPSVFSTTTYQYDTLGRLTNIAYPTGDTPSWNSATFAFSKLSAAENGIPANYWRHTTSTGNGRKVAYLDAQWRPVMTREYDNANAVGTQRFQRFTYDHEGRVTFASYPGSTDAVASGTFTFYDALGRVTKVSQDSEFGAGQPVETLTDYLPNFLTTTTNPLGQVTITSFKAYDQPTTDWPTLINHPESQQTAIARDAFGKPTSLTRSGNGLSSVRTYIYDDAQRLCMAVEPETAASVMDYDVAGNMIWQATGQAFNASSPCSMARAGAVDKVTRSYDARNRLSSLIFPDGRGNQSWTYTRDGLPAQVTTNNTSGGDQVVNAYAYNNRRLLTGESMTQPGSSAWSLGYAYDGNASLTGTTYPSALYVGYAPNALGQPTQAGSYATAVQYYPNGAIKQFTYGNGIVHTMTQNARQLPVRSSDIGGGTALDLGYSFDKNSNVSGIVDYVDGRQTRTMTYDGLDRLLTTTSVMFGGDNIARYTYDTLDNIATLKVGGNRDHTYVYGATDKRLLNIQNTAGGATVVGLAYDVRGNVVNKNGQLFDFDYGNRLRAATNAESYRYDGHGRRVRASAGSGNILSMYGQDGVLRRQEDWRTGKLTDYIYLGGSLVARVSNAPTLAAPVVTAPAYNTAGNYTVQWSSVTSATRYEAEEQLNAGTWSSLYSGTALSVAVAGKPSGSYGYRARACLASVCGAWSTVVVVAVQLPPEQAPSLSVPATALNGNFTVTWGTVSGATSYTLEQSANGGAWGASYTGAALSKAFTNIGAGSFSYRVKACNPAGCGDLSGVGTVQALYPPAAPATPGVPAQSFNGSYAVSWTAVATATSYRLEESVNGGGWGLIQDAASTSRSITGKVAGSYAYRVQACNAAGCSGYSGTAAVQVIEAPAGVPTLSAPADGGTGSYTVSWTGVATATSYRLEENTNGGGWSLIQDGAAASRAISGKPAGSYAYRVQGCNGAGCGPYSNVATVGVGPPVPAMPATLNVYRYGSLAPYTWDVNWSAVSGATSYEVREHRGTTITTIYTGSGLSTSASGVGTRSYSVRACNGSGCSAWNGPVSP